MKNLLSFLTFILLFLGTTYSQTWTGTQKIVASDRAMKDNFGFRLAISGNYAVVAAVGEDEDASGGNTLTDAGAAYVYERNVAGTWLQVQKIVASDRAANDAFGLSVAIYGNYIVIGTSMEGEDANGQNTKPSAGCAYIFERNAAGNWIETQKIVASDRASEDFFGYSVAIYGDYLVVGAYGDDENVNSLPFNYAGSAYIFKRNAAGNWIETQKIVASGRDEDAFFGINVAMFGDCIAIGADGNDNLWDDEGIVYIFKKNAAGNWIETQIIVASDMYRSDYFSRSISLSNDYLVVGAYREDEDATGGNTLDAAGSAYIFERDASGNWIETQKIVASDRAVNAQFGASVSVSNDYIIVGANRESKDVNGQNSLLFAGSAYLFKRNSSGNWTEVQKIVASDRASEDFFGFSAAISNSDIIIGAVREDEDPNGNNTMTDAGSIYVLVNPCAPTITGTLSACIGSTTQLTGSAPTAGSSWASASTGVATIDATTGEVTGVTGGTSVITYTDGNGCTTTKTVTVNSDPTISGTLSACVGTTTQLTGSAPTTGGGWSSATPAIATVSTTGLITGIATGTNTIKYTDGNGCEAATTVTISEATITGTLSVCIGSTTQLTGSAPTTGGTWTSATPAVATVNTTGLITGVTDGTSVITYTDGNGCEATATVTINAIPTINAVSPSECENVAGSGQALNIDVTGLEAGLNATGTFVWFTDNTYGTASVPQPTNVTVNNNEVFYFEVSINGCILQDSVTYTVGGNIILNDPLSEFCEDAPGSGQVSGIDLTTFNNAVFSGATSYTWATGPTGVTINNGDVINVEVVQGTCPPVNIDVNFTVNPLPTVTATTMSLCEDALGTSQATFDLTTLNGVVNGGAANTTVSWYANAADIPTTPIALATAFLTGSTTVYVQVENMVTNCTDTAAVLLDVIPAANAGLDGVDTLCGANGNTTNLTVLLSGNTAVGTWIDTTTSGQFNIATGVFDVTGLPSGDYAFGYVVSATAPCLDDTAEFIVTINASPTINAVSPSECENVTGSGQALNIDVTGLEAGLNATGTFVWFTDNTYGTASTPQPTNVTVNDNEVFYFELTINGCTLQDSVTYSVGGNITLNDPLPEFCEDAPGSGQVNGIDLTTFNTGVFSGATSYTWATGPTGVTINDGDVINVVVVQGTCPPVNIDVNFTVNPLPTVTATTMSLCEDVLGTSQATFDLTTLNATVGGSNTVAWYTDAALTTPAAPSNAFLTTTATVYAQVTDPTTGCGNSVAVTLTVNPLPVVTTATMNICDDGTGQASFDLSTLNATVGGSNTVVWYTDATLTIPAAPANAFITGTATVYAEVTDPTTGCGNSVAVTLTVDPLPAVNAATMSICDDRTGQATFDLTTLNTTVGGANTVAWYTDASLTTAVIPANAFVTTSTTVYAQVTDPVTGCTAITAVVLTVSPAPLINAGTDVRVVLGESTPLNAVGSNGTYTWDPPTWLSCPTCLTTIATPEETTTYTITVQDTNGCVSSDDVTVILDYDLVVFVPNIFSPNGDGNNDILYVRGVGIESINFFIYDRWGEKVFETKSVDKGWDGTFRGKKMNNSVFVYYLKVTFRNGTKIEKKGDITLTR